MFGGYTAWRARSPADGDDGDQGAGPRVSYRCDRDVVFGYVAEYGRAQLAIQTDWWGGHAEGAPVGWKLIHLIAFLSLILDARPAALAAPHPTNCSP